MSITSPIVSSISSPIHAGVCGLFPFSKLSTAITKTLITLDPVLNSYYTLASPITFTGACELNYDIASTNTGIDASLEDSWKFNSTEFDSYILIYIDNPDGLTLIIGNVGGLGFTRFTFGGQLEILNGELNTVTIIRDVVGDISAYLNGVQLGGTYNDTSTWTLEGNLGGNKVAGRYLDGIIANPKFTDNSGVPVTTTFKLGNATGNIENSLENNNALTYINIPESNRELFTLADEGWLGQELWNHNNLVGLTGDWSSTESQVYELNGSVGYLLKPSAENIKFNTLTTFSWEKVTGSMRVGSSGMQTITESGDYSVTGADNTALGFKRNSGLVVGTLSNVHQKRLIEVP